MADTVLVVEDDPDIVELLELYLGGSGFEVVSASDGAEALRMLEARPADVALVDIMMPHMNGYDFIKALRERSDMPVIIVSARTSPADKIVGLDTGADGFVAKPFDPLEVVAYVRAALRRWGAPGRPEAGAEEAAPRCLTVGDLTFDPERLTLSRAGEPVPLTAAELKIMAKLMSSPGRVFTKAQLYACVSGEDGPGGEGSVMVHISNIRAKLEEDPLHPRHIRTVRGLGYRIDA